MHGGHFKLACDTDSVYMQYDIALDDFMMQIVSNSESGIDVDKVDYIIRDCHGLGIQHGLDWQ